MEKHPLRFTTKGTRWKLINGSYPLERPNNIHGRLTSQNDFLSSKVHTSTYKSPIMPSPSTFTKNKMSIASNYVILYHPTS
jgi:hypothetical protein